MLTKRAITVAAITLLMAVSAHAQIIQVLDSSGSGAATGFDFPQDIAVDAVGNAYVGGYFSDNVFKIEPDGDISEIIDDTGDGAGNPLGTVDDVAVDGAGNLFVAGESSDNVFKITPNGDITEIIDTTGDGRGNMLVDPNGVAADAEGNAYLVAFDKQTGKEAWRGERRAKPRGGWARRS